MIDFKLPALGADMDEATLLEWNVQPGDVIKKGQVVAVVDTTKAAVDIECWQEGTVGDLLVQPGEKIPVGTPLATLLEAGEKAGPKKASGTAPTKGAAAVTPERKAVSPAARKRAKELGVDLAAVTGTGAKGAVTLDDIERATTKAVPTDKAAEMRKAIAAAMSRSKREIPHYYLGETIPMAKAMAWLESENAKRGMDERLLPAVLLLKAVARALKRYPEFNGFHRDGGFQPSSAVHVGVAISLRQGGLIAPAILDADAKSLTQLMHYLTDLVQRTRAGSLKSSEMSEPTITVTNLGDQGVDTVFGVIYPPQVALVGFGRIARRPMEDDGQLTLQPSVVASLAADHRVSDGHRGALFLLELRELLQHPEEL